MNKSFVLDNNEMKRLHLCFHQSPIISMASFMISTQLLNNGLSFCVGTDEKCRKTMKMDAKQEAMVNDVWLPFARQCLDSVLCYGFVVVLIVDDIPRVMEVGTYTIKIEVLPTGYEWHVSSIGDVEEDMKDVYVYDIFGHSPTQDGIFTSPVSKVLPRLIYLKQLRETSLLMEFRRADVTVFSESKDTQSSAQKENVDYDFYADAGAGKIDEDMKFTRNKTNIRLLQQQNDLFDQMLGRGHARKSMQAMENVVPLPMGHTMKAPPQTTGRGDLVSIHKSIEEEVCGTLGVPRSLMIADGGGGLGHTQDKEGLHETFMHTILFYKRTIGIVLSDIYNKLYYEDIKSNIDFHKDQDIYELKKKHSISVYFPVTPFVSNKQLRELYEQGIIEWQTYARYALCNVNLPLSDMKAGGPPPIDELLFEKPEKKVEKEEGKKEEKEEGKKEEKEEGKKKEKEEGKKEEKEEGKKDKGKKKEEGKKEDTKEPSKKKRKVDN